MLDARCLAGFLHIHAEVDQGDERLHVDARLVIAGHDGEGATGFGPSPVWSQPHTIFEFRAAVPDGPISVGCMDPVSESTCGTLTCEGVVFAIQPGSPTLVGRIVDTSIPQIAPGGACGEGQGLCMNGSTCVGTDMGNAGFCAVISAVVDAGGPVDLPPDASNSQRDAGPPPT